jgi:hypothetical protein
MRPAKVVRTDDMGRYVKEFSRETQHAKNVLVKLEQELRYCKHIIATGQQIAQRLEQIRKGEIDPEV